MIESVVTFKWRPALGYRSTFTSAHVNCLRRQFVRHLPVPHRFICVTDDDSGLDSEIEAVPLWDTYRNLRNPTWPKGPNCYPRLPTFGVKFREIAGERFAVVDLDIVLTDEVLSLFGRSEDFVIWGTGNVHIPYCASMYMMTAGAKQEVLDRFDPVTSPRISNSAGYRGSDQAWINYCLGRKIPVWGKADGVYSYRDHLVKQHRGKLPYNARVIIFHGKPDPWDAQAISMSPWIREHRERALECLT